MIAPALAALFVLASPGGGSPPPAPCALPPGATIMLRSDELDPDVFVWDTRGRAIDYAAGRWRSTADVTDHSALSKPGTRAVVVTCEPGVVRSKYTRSDLDLIGIRVTSGPNRGRYGWVTGDDAHAVAGLRAAATATTRER